MRWRTHTDHICTVTRKLIGLLYRQFYNNVDSASLLELYRSMIRPHLKYAAAVWDPHLARDKDQLEKVQKFALRMCCKSWEEGYHMLLEDCGFPTLEARRQYLKLCTLFKIILGEQFYQPGVFVQKVPRSGPSQLPLLYEGYARTVSSATILCTCHSPRLEQSTN